MIINNVSIEQLNAIKQAATTALDLANAAMPISGGTFTGNAIAVSFNRSGECLRNIEIGDQAGTIAVSTNRINFNRK